MIAARHSAGAKPGFDRYKCVSLVMLYKVLGSCRRRLSPAAYLDAFTSADNQVVWVVTVITWVGPVLQWWRLDNSSPDLGL